VVGGDGGMQELVGLHRPRPQSIPPVDHWQGPLSGGSEGEEAPMDLSSGGVTSLGRVLLGEGVTSLGRAFCGGLPMADHPLLNASRLAELVRQQHKESEAREEREGKRVWQDEEENQEVTSSLEAAQQPGSLIPLQLIRAKWKKCRTSPDLNTEARTSPDSHGPASPASSGSESGREVKKRRLDALLSKKFERVASQDNSTPVAMPLSPTSSTAMPLSPAATPTSPTATPSSPITSDPITLSQIGRRLSEEKGSTNRRKQSHPTSPKSPAALTIKSHADLFPPATSTPRDVSPVHISREARPHSRETRPLSSNRARSPRERSRSPVSIVPESPGKEELLRNQILQMQLASAGGLFGSLSGGSPPMGLGSIPGLGSSSPNPLMYYSYYAQMLQTLQAQQKLLELNLPSGMPGSPAPSSPGSPANLKNLLSPLRLAGLPNLKTEPRQNEFPAFSPRYSGRPSSMLPSPLGSSSIHSGDNETRRRAPRALTGRYVKTGTAASPKVLQILRKKVEDRLRLKELLGDNSQLYFGAVNKQQQQHHKQQQHKQQQHQKFNKQIKMNNNVIKHVNF